METVGIKWSNSTILRLFVNTSKNAFAPLAGVAPAPAPYKEAALRCATKVFSLYQLYPKP